MYVYKLVCHYLLRWCLWVGPAAEAESHHRVHEFGRPPRKLPLPQWLCFDHDINGNASKAVEV